MAPKCEVQRLKSGKDTPRTRPTWNLKTTRFVEEKSSSKGPLIFWGLGTGPLCIGLGLRMTAVPGPSVSLLRADSRLGLAATQAHAPPPRSPDLAIPDTRDGQRKSRCNWAQLEAFNGRLPQFGWTRTLLKVDRTLVCSGEPPQSPKKEAPKGTKRGRTCGISYGAVQPLFGLSWVAAPKLRQIGLRAG